MPRAQADKAYVNFVSGLITEANPLSFPDGAALDLDNVLIGGNGSLHRRYGADFEDDYVSLGMGDQSYVNYAAISVHRWKSVAGNGDLDFTVVQIGDRLDVFDSTAEVMSDSLIATIDISSAAVTFAGGKASKLQSAHGKGRLFLCGKLYNPFYVEYDPDTRLFSIQQTTIEIRDFDRLEDNLKIDENPSTLTKEHEYNLKNQGWLSAHIKSYKSSTTKYPSNAQIWHVAKDSSDNFSATKLDKINFGNTAAPNGRFILNAFKRDRSFVSDVGGFQIEIERNRPETVSFFAGRVWYAGIDSDALSGHVLFSQILEDLQINNAGKCYQEQDPTAEEFNDLLDTDGGAIIIPEAGQIYKLIPLNDTMMVVASNGVWLIKGSDGGFNASAYSVDKVSEFGAISAGAVVQAESTILYWSESGIYAIGLDPNSVGTYSAQDTSRTTIRTLYTNIPLVAKKEATSYYDSVGKRVYWAYNDSVDYTGILYKYNFNKMLILDFNTERPAFVKLSFDYDEGVVPGIAGLLFHKNNSILSTEDPVVIGGDPVVVDSDPVVISLVDSTTSIDSLHLLVLYKNGMDYEYTFGHLKNKSFVDWEANGNSLDYESFVQTGFENLGDIMRAKALPYVYSYFERTETSYTGTAEAPVFDFPSGCTVQGRWAWADGVIADKWTTPQQAYSIGRGYNALITPSDADITGDGFSVVSSRRRIRGSGKAVSLLYKSVSGKDFILLGWSVPYTASGSPS